MKLACVRWMVVAALALWACGDDSETESSAHGAGGSTSTGGGAATQTGAGAGGAQPGDGVSCAPGEAPCDPSRGEYCCFPLVAMPATCETDSDACDANFAVLKHCDGPEDCAGALCCHTASEASPRPGAGIAECADTCEGAAQAIVCDPDEAAPCPAGQSCQMRGPLPLCE